MSLYFPVFIIAVLIAFVLLIIHSIKYRGIKETIKFFGFGFIFGLIREIIYSTFLSNYSFGEMPLQILGVPLTIIFGWLFTFYMGFCLNEKFFKSENESDYMRLILLNAIFSSFICFSIETIAMYMEWWEVFFESSNFAASDLLAGWFYTTLLYFSIYFVLFGKIKKNKNRILPILIVILIFMVEITDSLMIANNGIIIITCFIFFYAAILILYPYLVLFLITLFLLFLINPIRLILDNDLRILVVLVVEFIYLIVILKFPETFEKEIIKLGEKKKLNF